MKKRREVWLVIGILVVGGLLWRASQHQPTGPATGSRLYGEEFLRSNDGTLSIRERVGVRREHVTTDSQRQGPKTQTAYSVLRTSFSSGSPYPNPLPEGEGRNIRFATWNIHGGKGTDGRKDFQRIASTLKGYDFVALQEVHGPGLLGGMDQVEILGRQREMAWLFAPAIRQWCCKESGNGLLSKLPITFWQRIPLPSYEDYSFRNIVFCRIDLPGLWTPNRSLHVLITHLNCRHDTDRAAQLQIVLSLFLSLRAPAVLMGDLNSTRQTPQIRKLLEDGQVVDPVEKMSARNMPGRVDWILTRGMKCRDAGIIETEASDHPLVWAELETACD